MSTVLTRESESQSPVETVEAVIISGPRKGEIVTLGDTDAAQLTSAEEAALDDAIDAAQRVVESSVALRVQAQEFGAELERINGKYDGLLGESGRADGASADDRRGDERRAPRKRNKPTSPRKSRSKDGQARAAA